ncbi:SigE family RNA polymerase sigma factor [Streptomyces sp. NBC_01451]|uniref:SigE family RNA polymerase sigma factor n=1 Tax=Streptomyces sp. NBC_01451 TaxID=2903872 RepID=UPI002E2F08A8|nr:SigE family RNA polymerase sigma factor [Streptomyces sp. NBC_01451]
MDLATEWKPGAALGGAESAGAGSGEMDFPLFVATRSASLFRGALVLTGNREAAEDLVQETLERVCRKWRTVAAKDAPDAYVRRIMVNLANDRWRRFRRLVPLVPSGAHQDTGDRAALGDEYGRVDSRDQLVRALQSLPMRMRTVVVLRYFHDLSDAEIAADLRISPSTVRSQLARGIDKLRSQFSALSGPSPSPPSPTASPQQPGPTGPTGPKEGRTR